MIHYRTKHDAQSSHRQIVQIIRQLPPRPVLDVGSAQGMLGQALGDDGLVIDAIEPNVAWSEAAHPFYRTVYNCTIEACDLPSAEYGIIVCADVLEHVANPVEVMGRLRAAGESDATFIISLPNVAHLSIRLLLLAGHFPRMDRGSLDKTHLHFFTRSTAIEMLHSAGLRVKEVRATPVPLEQITSSKILNMAGGWTQRLLIRVMPRVFAYQWILIAEAA